MVLITGTDLRVEDLPNNDVVDYVIENKKMALKLKTVAKKPSCIQIYIIESQRTEYTITDEIAGKIQYFKNDEELINLLKYGMAHQSVDIFDENYEDKDTKNKEEKSVSEDILSVDETKKAIAMVIPDNEKSQEHIIQNDKICLNSKEKEVYSDISISEKEKNTTVEKSVLPLDMDNFDDLGDKKEVKSSDYTTTSIDFGSVSDDLSFNHKEVYSISDVEKKSNNVESVKLNSIESEELNITELETPEISKKENNNDTHESEILKKDIENSSIDSNSTLDVLSKTDDLENKEDANIGLFIDLEDNKDKDNELKISNSEIEQKDKEVREDNKESYNVNDLNSRFIKPVNNTDIFKDNRAFIDNVPNIDICSIIGDMDIKEVDTFLPDSMLSIPNIDEDTDSMDELLLKKDKIIAQKDKIINELNRNIESAYKAQEIQVNEIQDLYNKKLTEAQNIIDTLQKKLQNISFTDEMTEFLKLINFAKNYKGCVPEDFNSELYQKIGNLSSKYFIFCSSGGDSLHIMLKQFKKLIEKSCNCVIYDFTNDNFLASSYRIDMKKSSTTMDLLKDEQKPILKEINSTYFLPTTNYNDIALLNANWVDVIKRIDEISCGKQVILLFGNINNFAVRYTVSQLSAIGKLFLCVKCSPVILSTMFSDLQFMPIKNMMIVALEYIDIVKSILEGIAKRYNVYATAKDIEWGSKIGLRK